MGPPHRKYNIQIIRTTTSQVYIHPEQLCMLNPQTIIEIIWQEIILHLIWIYSPRTIHENHFWLEQSNTHDSIHPEQITKPLLIGIK